MKDNDLAGLWKRVGGALIDFIIVVVITFGIVFCCDFDLMLNGTGSGPAHPYGGEETALLPKAISGARLPPIAIPRALISPPRAPSQAGFPFASLLQGLRDEVKNRLAELSSQA